MYCIHCTTIPLNTIFNKALARFCLLRILLEAESVLVSVLIQTVMLTPSGQRVGRPGLQCSEFLHPLLEKVNSKDYKNQACRKMPPFIFKHLIAKHLHANLHIIYLTFLLH